MPVKIRSNGQWIDMDTGFSTIPPSPTGLTGYWENITSSRDFGNEYSNSNISYQSITYRLDSSNTSLIAGSSIHGYIKDPSSNTWIKSSIHRDNGTAAATTLFLNTGFFVPNGYSYKVLLYNKNLNEWTSSSSNLTISKISWSQFIVQLYYQ